MAKNLSVLMGGDMEIESQVNYGTKVKFWIKTQNEMFNEPFVLNRSVTSFPNEYEHQCSEIGIHTKLSHYASDFNIVLLSNIYIYIYIAKMH